MHEHVPERYNDFESGVEALVNSQTPVKRSGR
jgi:hypothetical protein